MLTSTQILNDWEDGVHYNGDIDDLIDAIYEEELPYTIVQEVLEEELPSLPEDKREELAFLIINALEEDN